MNTIKDPRRFIIQRSATWTPANPVWIVLHADDPGMTVLVVGTVTECAKYIEEEEGKQYS